MKERQIFLIRHGETELSEKKRLIGQHDVALSTKGIDRSHQVGKWLQSFHFDHLLCSGLNRTKQMAEIIASYVDLTPQSMSELNEISLGEWDGLYIDDIKAKYPEEFDKRGKDIVHYQIAGGENFLALHTRIQRIFQDILKQEGNILIVSHAAVNRVILCDVLDIPLNNIFKISQDYGCCNILIQKEKDLYVKLVNGKISEIRD